MASKFRRMVGILLCVSAISGVGFTYVEAEEVQQVNISPTPASIILPSPLPLSTQAVSTPVLTYTPSPIGPVLLEALTEANVRAEADPEAELLGTIRAGDVYAVVGRYFRWFQFQFDQSPTGTGWVFDELVTIIGDENEILDLSENALPTTDNTAAAATNMMLEITQTPGGILTATAASLVVPLPVETSAGFDSQVPNHDSSGLLTALPTFTYPPDVPAVPPDTALQPGSPLDATPTLFPDGLVFSSTEGVPPILPILALGGFGLLGLAITSFRR